MIASIQITEHRIIPGTQIKFRSGDTVARADDGREFEGVVVAVNNNSARVQWGPSLSNAKEWIDQGDLYIVKRRSESPESGGSTGPKTVVESPRRQLERRLAEIRSIVKGE